MTRGILKRIHSCRSQAFEAAIADFFRSGGTMSVENRTDWKDAIVASDGQMDNQRQMAIYDLRDFGPLPEKLRCYHAFVEGGMEYIEFFLEREGIHALETYIRFGKWE